MVTSYHLTHDVVTAGATEMDPPPVLRAQDEQQTRGKYYFYVFTLELEQSCCTSLLWKLGAQLTNNTLVLQATFTLYDLTDFVKFIKAT